MRLDDWLARAAEGVPAQTALVAGDRRLGPIKTKAAVRDVRLPAYLVDGLEQLLRVATGNDLR